MRGLRTPLDNRSENFFAIVEETAKKRGCIFFLESETGTHDLELEKYSLFDSSGWLVPEKDVEKFEKEYRAFEESEDDRWTKYFCWAAWEYNDATIKIHFEDELGNVV